MHSLLSDSSINQSHSNLYFELTNCIQSCSLNQPITTLVLITINDHHQLLNHENCNIFYDQLVLGLHVIQFCCNHTCDKQIGLLLRSYLYWICHSYDYRPSKTKSTCQNSTTSEHFQKWPKNQGVVLALSLSIGLHSVLLPFK